MICMYTQAPATHLQQLASCGALSQLLSQLLATSLPHSLELLLQCVHQEGADGCQGVGDQGGT